MSVTYSLFCPETKMQLWVGQHGAGSKEPWLYEDWDLLTAFLNAHKGKNVIYDSDFREDGIDYQEYKLESPQPPISEDI